MINARVMQATPDGGNAQHFQDQAVASVVFVTPENSTRLAINNAFMKETAAKLPNNVYPIRVIANFKGALNGLSRSDLCYVLSLPDNRFGRMATFLDLVQGMPIQVTQNVATAKGVANDTLGILEYVHFPTSTHYRLPHAASIRPGLVPELFPVFFTTEAYKKANIKLAPAPDGQPCYVKVRPQQFPFVCAVGSIVYKVQGETLQSMIVIDWKSTQPLANTPQQTYLLVSPVTTRNGLTALAPLTPKLVEWSKPSDHALHEEERLNDLSNATLEEFHLPVTTVVTDQYRDGNNPQSRDEAP
ncbi:hypothetical protein F441_22613 [Phytophthora nicotianae CJ01A1]|uniref:Uncharacterized protein n=1 Tax=Phytophthora nicotianae CJ01A1 TaxID=1317063 RepID=W2VP53_PHYNI|nr:hypothetical protein F441_22613 [Phytophthora nicotianae CJ01A1]